MNKIGHYTVEKIEVSVHIINDCCYSGRFIQDAKKYILDGRQNPNLILLTVESSSTEDTYSAWKRYRLFKEMLKKLGMTEEQIKIVDREYRR